MALTQQVSTERAVRVITSHPNLPASLKTRPDIVQWYEELKLATLERFRVLEDEIDKLKRVTTEPVDLSGLQAELASLSSLFIALDSRVLALEDAPAPAPPAPAPAGVNSINGQTGDVTLKLTVAGTVNLNNGISSGTVVGLGLSFVPTQCVLMMVKPAGGLQIFASLVKDTLSADGFGFELSGFTDSADYQLAWMLL